MEHNLAAGVSTRDPLERIAHLLERERRLDLWAQTAGLDQPPNLVELLPVDLGVERLPHDAAPQPGGSTALSKTCVPRER